MSKQKAALLSSQDTNDLIELIIDCIQDIKGKNIMILDLRKLDDAPTNFFIICEGDSNIQVRAIADNIYSRLKKEIATLPNHMEGADGARWVLVDYFDTVVHVFYKETRTFYDLEDLWSDAEFTTYPDI